MIISAEKSGLKTLTQLSSSFLKLIKNFPWPFVLKGSPVESLPRYQQLSNIDLHLKSPESLLKIHTLRPKDSDICFLLSNKVERN